MNSADYDREFLEDQAADCEATVNNRIDREMDQWIWDHPGVLCYEDTARDAITDLAAKVKASIGEDTDCATDDYIRELAEEWLADWKWPGSCCGNHDLHATIKCEFSKRWHALCEVTVACHSCGISGSGRARSILAAGQVAVAAWQAIADRLVAQRPRFPMVYCSSCGKGFGPGDHGYSHCANHAGRAVVED